MTAIAKPKCAMCGGVPFGVSLDPNAPVFCSLECEGGWRRQQREGSFLAALNLTPKPTFEAWGDLDLGAPEEAWACAIERFREEARINRQCAEQQRKLSVDAAEQAEQHARRAEDYTNLAAALERAPITFNASCDRNPKGEDVQQASSRSDESAVGSEADETPNHQSKHHHQGHIDNDYR